MRIIELLMRAVTHLNIGATIALLAWVVCTSAQARPIENFPTSQGHAAAGYSSASCNVLSICIVGRVFLNAPSLTGEQA